MSSEEQWIEDVLSGDTNAFAQLVDRHKLFAFNVAFGILKDENDAEEAAQDAFVKAYRNLKGFDRRSKFRTWLYRIVTNESLSRARKKKLTFVDMKSANRIEANPTSTGENRELIHRGLTSLDQKDAEVLTLFYLKELSLDEMSEILNLTSNTIKVAVHRARQRLAKKMLELLGEEALELIKD